MLFRSGIEIPVTRLLGKWKTSQNRVAVDRAGVVKGLQEVNGPDAATMANAVAALDARQ